MKNKILYIASADFNLKSGGAFANLAFYKSLVKHYGNRVDLIPFCNTRPNLIESRFYAPPKNMVTKFLDFFKGSIHRFNPWIFNFLKKYGNDYSCCIINDGLKGDIIPAIKKVIPKVIVIHHNCEVDFQNDNNRPTTLFGIFPYWVKKNEELSYKLADLNLFLTEYDMLRFQKLYGRIDNSKRAVVGIYLHENYDKDVDKLITTSKFTICGSLNNIQTIKGIKEFSNLLPILKKQVGESLVLTIAGRNPGKYIKNFSACHSCIKLIENPSNMSDILLESDIFICPINVGSGLKLRVMDGLKLGMPVITHEVSARGYEFFFNEPWFKVYNDKASFEKSLIELIEYCKSNKNLRSLIINKFKSLYTFENGDKRFIGLINDYVNG